MLSAVQRTNSEQEACQVLPLRLNYQCLPDSKVDQSCFASSTSIFAKLNKDSKVGVGAHCTIALMRVNVELKLMGYFCPVLMSVETVTKLSKEPMLALPDPSAP